MRDVELKWTLLSGWRYSEHEGDDPNWTRGRPRSCWAIVRPERETISVQSNDGALLWQRRTGSFREMSSSLLMIYTTVMIVNYSQPKSLSLSTIKAETKHQKTLHSIPLSIISMDCSVTSSISSNK